MAETGSPAEAEAEVRPRSLAVELVTAAVVTLRRPPPRPCAPAGWRRLAEAGLRAG